MPHQLHDCKCIGSRFARTNQAGMPRRMDDELLHEDMLPEQFLAHANHRLADPDRSMRVHVSVDGTAPMEPEQLPVWQRLDGHNRAAHVVLCCHHESVSIGYPLCLCFLFLRMRRRKPDSAPTAGISSAHRKLVLHCDHADCRRERHDRRVSHQYQGCGNRNPALS
jgi:hypothetical protein